MKDLILMFQRLMTEAKAVSNSSNAGLDASHDISTLYQTLPEAAVVLRAQREKYDGMLRTIANAHVDCVAAGTQSVANDLLELLDSLDPDRDALREVDPENPLFDDEDME